MSIQPVNKAAEHLINSTPVLGEETKKREKKKRNSDCLSLIKNGKGAGGGGGGGTITSSRKDWAEYYVTVELM